MKTTFLSMGIVLLAAAAPAQTPVNLQTSAYRNSIAQEEVRKQAEQARAQLQLLLEDFQQNGMNSAEFGQVQQTVGQLSSLSDKEIQPLVQVLKDVGSQQISGAEGKLTTASQAQKNIQVSLKTMSDHLALQMNEASMEKRLEQLVLSQTGNLKHTRELAVSGKSGDKLPTELVSLYTLSKSEQISIKRQSELMLTTLEKVVAAMPENKCGGFAAALSESKKIGLEAMASTAVADLSGGKFPEALGSGGRLLDGLQVLLMKIREGKPVAERVGAMAGKLQQLAADQAALAQATEKGEPQAQQELKEQQSKISNEVAALKKELTGLNAPAATLASQAEKSIEVAEGKLSEKAALKKDEKAGVAEAQADAAKKLQAAGDALQDQAKKMAADTASDAAKTPAEAMQQLADLDKEVKDALAKQKALDSAPGAAAPGDQKNLAEETAKLQEKALAASPQAAPSLGQAAAQMAASASSPSPSSAPSASPESTPAAALAEASAQIQSQLAAAQAALNQQAALAAMAAPIQAAKDQATAAGEGIELKKDLTDAVKKMMDAQKSVADAQASSAGAPADVPGALKDAQAALDSAVLEAAQSKGQQAGAANAQAKAALDKALKSLNGAMAEAAAAAAAAAPAMAGAPGKPGAEGAPAPGAPGESTPGQNEIGQNNQNGGGVQAGVQDYKGSSGEPGVNGQVSSGIKPKDRDAVSLLQKEKAPAEYRGMVQQYLKNLAEGAAPGHGVQ